MFCHHCSNGIEEETHVLAARRTWRPIGEPFKTVEGNWFQGGAPKEIVGAGVHDESHAQAMQGISDPAEFLRAQARDEIQVPVLPQHDLRLQQHDVAGGLETAECGVIRVSERV